MAFSSRPVRYATDDTINEYVTDHFESISNISRDEFVKYPISDQRIIYRTFDEKKRNEIWRNKLLNEASYYTGEKATFLINLSKTLNTKDAEKLKKMFGLQKAINIAAQPAYRTDSQLPSRFLYIEAGLKKGAQIQSCECSTYSDWCACESKCKEIGSCQINLNYGCGTFFGYQCNAMCAPDANAELCWF